MTLEPIGGLIGLGFCTITGIGTVLELGVNRGAWEVTIFLLILLSVLGYVSFIGWIQE